MSPTLASTLTWKWRRKDLSSYLGQGGRVALTMVEGEAEDRTQYVLHGAEDSRRAVGQNQVGWVAKLRAPLSLSLAIASNDGLWATRVG